MASIRDPRAAAGSPGADYGFIDPAAPDRDRRRAVRLDCPPEIALSFVARVLSASQSERRQPLFVELRSPRRSER